VVTRHIPSVEFGYLCNKTGVGFKIGDIGVLIRIAPSTKTVRMATDIEPADVKPADVAAAVIVTPGAARVPMTGVVDGTEFFLGVGHRDYSEDDVTDEEQKKERNKKRSKTTNILDRDYP
jgi:hypothetical protein